MRPGSGGTNPVKMVLMRFARLPMLYERKDARVIDVLKYECRIKARLAMHAFLNAVHDRRKLDETGVRRFESDD